MDEGLYVVSVTGNFKDNGWEGITEFYFQTLDEAFSFFDSEAKELVPEAYKHLAVSEFEVSIWDDTEDNGEELESFTVYAL